MEQPPAPTKQDNWKTRTYVTGATLGTFFGVIASYLYARSAEENKTTKTEEKPEAIPTGQLIGVLLAALGLIRQIAEMGKPKKKK